MDQGSQEWTAARLGKVTASRMSDVIAKIKTGWGASRANYMAELIAERLTGEPAPSYTNAAMQWGTEKEPDARAAYEFYKNCEVVQVGFIAHPTIAMSGASPDGYVGDDGMIEIKAPNTANHIDTLLGQAIPDKYIVQMLWQMNCAERKWCDFVSYDPRLPETMRLHIQRVPRDSKRIVELEQMAQQFLSELDEKLAALKQRYESTVLAA
jgi:putative phage-type endonuclease